MHVANPTEVRKAAAFVEKISQLEDEFGFVLHVPDDGLLLGPRGSKPVFALAREDRPGVRPDPLFPAGLALGMTAPEPASPAYPFPRD